MLIKKNPQEDRRRVNTNRRRVGREAGVIDAWDKEEQDRSSGSLLDI